MREPTRRFVLLVAEDNEGDRRLTQEALADNPLDLDLRFVEDGQQLLDYLRHQGTYSDPQNSPHPGLILLDLHMPRKNGHEALREIKSDATLRDIPVVVLTTSQEPADLWQSFDFGITHFMAKPLDSVALANLIEEFGAYFRRQHR
ncbi:MAG: response regulator [Abitibacteriaceae bacterium]|nr:response regulator [Abditibacteriaceae bacterium]MBV9868415.1 response regulator [Abditibacteriaceae bacterium]